MTTTRKVERNMIHFRVVERICFFSGPECGFLNASKVKQPGFEQEI